MAGETSTSSIVSQIVDQLAKIFRHMLPGVTIITIAAASHPSWFKPAYFSTSWALLVFAIIAITVGNTWYVLHRYSLHQFLDWIIYLWKRRSPQGYLVWLGEHIYKSFHVAQEHAALREHLVFRSAQIIFLFVTCEVALLFSLSPETHTFYQEHALWIRVAATFGLLVAVVQHFISNILDVYLIEKCTTDQL